MRCGPVFPVGRRPSRCSCPRLLSAPHRSARRGDDRNRLSGATQSAGACERRGAAPQRGFAGRRAATAFRAPAVGVGLSCALCRVLARTRQLRPGPAIGGDRLPAAPRRVAAQGLVPPDRHPHRRRGECAADGLFSTGPCHVPPRSGIVGRRIAPRRRCCGFALRGGAGRLYGGDHRRRPARRNRRRRCKCSLPAGRHASQRDRPRHCLRRHRPGADRFRCQPAPSGRAVRGADGRDRRRPCRHTGLGWARTGGHAACSARVHPADRRPRPADRRDTRGIVPDPLSLAGVAEGGWRLASPLCAAGGRWQTTSPCCPMPRPGKRVPSSRKVCRRSCGRLRRRWTRSAGLPTRAASIGSARRQCAG